MERYQQIVQPIARNRATEQLLDCCLLAAASYVQDEFVIENTLKVYLGTGNVERFFTPSQLQVNYVLSAQPDGIVVAFSGTENLSQFLYYTCTSLNAPREDLQNKRCHVGFGNIASDVLADLKRTIPRDCLGAPMTLIGHSLGGAVAYLIAAMLKSNPIWDVKNIITFGMPASGTFDLKSLVFDKNRVFVVNQGDPVPYLPPEIGLNFRVLQLNPTIWAFYHYEIDFPWLMWRFDGTYAVREGILFNLPRSIAQGVWAIISGKRLKTSPDPIDSLQDHFVLSYYERMVLALKSNIPEQTFNFHKAMFNTIERLTTPGQFTTELTQVDYNNLITQLGYNQGLVGSTETPRDPYVAFSQWCNGLRRDIRIEVGLYDAPIPKYEIALSNIHEPIFQGYRRANDSVWIKKESTGGAWFGAQTGQLTWVQIANNPGLKVYGAFAVMIDGPTTTLIGAEDFREPVEMGTQGQSVSIWCQSVAFLQSYQRTGMQAAAEPPNLYSYGYFYMDQLDKLGNMTNFNESILYPNRLASLPITDLTGVSGTPRTWWQYRGKDRLMIEKALAVLLSISKRDAKNYEAGEPVPYIFDLYDADLMNAVQMIIEGLEECLQIVHLPG